MIDKDKIYKTKEGHDVRIYATDGNGAYPVHGAVLVEGKGWLPEKWTNSGYYINNDPANNFRDLVEVKERITREYWVNVYDDNINLFSSKMQADMYICSDRLACVSITIDCEEGDGLE